MSSYPFAFRSGIGDDVFSGQLVLNIVAGTDGKTHESIVCNYCRVNGHYAGDCPKLAAKKLREQENNQGDRAEAANSYFYIRKDCQEGKIKINYTTNID